MHVGAGKDQQNKSKAAASEPSQITKSGEGTFSFVDNRAEAIQLRKLRAIADNSLQAQRIGAAISGPRAHQQEADPVALHTAAAPGNTIQLERFIGQKAGHHLHIEIHQDHYKEAKSDASRIELGKNGNYKLDQLIHARNYLVNNQKTASGGQACIDWLEDECATFQGWDGQYIPSWERREVEENPHAEGTLSRGDEVGYQRGDFENTLQQARNDALEELSDPLDPTKLKSTGTYVFEEGKTAADVEQAMDAVTLDEILARWMGFPTGEEALYSPEDMAAYFRREAKAWLIGWIMDEKFPADTSGEIEFG